jgi:LysR family glycine cleavage system transcriptional activator
LSAGKLVVACDSPLNCGQAYYVVSAGPGLERSIAGLFREWLLDEAGYTGTDG